MEWALLGAAAGAQQLFSYNRNNFFFDKKQEQKRQYTGQEMRIKQFELYREDVRDLVDLTVAKMDIYHIVNILLLGFSIILFTEGKPHTKWPLHLYWLFVICNAGAVMYIVMSIWLAMNASISAHSFGVRLLTQFVRLPVPNKHQLDAARAHAQEFEGMNATNLLRIPVLKQQMKRLNRAMDNMTEQDGSGSDGAGSDAGSQDNEYVEDTHTPAVMLRHIKLYREVQINWQSYDAYSRVCMAMGTNQLLHALGYYCVGTLIAESGSWWTGLACVVVFTMAAWLLARLDLYLSYQMLALAGFLIMASPVLSLVIVTVKTLVSVPQVTKDVSEIFFPLVFALHVAWLAFVVYIARADLSKGVALPMAFRTVTYLDVFGWISTPMEEPLPGASGGAAEASAMERLSGGCEAQDVVHAIGTRVRVTFEGFPSEPGIVRFNGTTHIDDGNWTGVELQRPMGINDGSVQGVRYFQCAQRHGIFVEPHRVFAEEQREDEEDPADFFMHGFPSTPRVSFGGSTGSAREIVPSFRASLLDLCRRLRAEIGEDLERWEADAVKQLMEDDLDRLEAIREMRSQFQEASAEFIRAENSDRTRRASSSSAAGVVRNSTGRQRVWLQLEWNPSGHANEFFYNCADGQTTWVRPRSADDRICDLEALRLQINTFADKVVALAGSPSPTAPVLSGPPPVQRVPWPPMSLSPGDGELQAASLDQAVAGTVATSAPAISSTPSWYPPSSAVERGCLSSIGVSAGQARTSTGFSGVEESPAQEPRFGGGEAVCFPEASPFFGHDSDTRDTFYPRSQERTRRLHERRLPGQMPWLTFAHGSYALLGVWTFGTLWCVLNVCGIDVRLEPVPSNDDPINLATTPDVAFAGSWPHPFFRPRSLACNPDRAYMALVAERYAVHELRLDGVRSAARPALVECLLRYPEFQASGFQSITIVCSDLAAVVSRSCDAVLLGASGRDALRCTLDDNMQATKHTLAARLTLHGGPWRALVATDGAMFWGLREGSALAKLGQRHGVVDELVPQLEVPHAVHSNFTHLHVHGAGPGAFLLALDSGGHLRAWPLDGGRALAWRLPAVGKAASWTAMCTTMDALHVLGGPLHAAGEASVWRIPLPPELLANSLVAKF